MIIHSSRKKIFIVALAALALVVGGAVSSYAQPAQPTLNPLNIPKYQVPLLIPPVMPKAGSLPNPGGKAIDYYEISVKQFQQQILPPVPPIGGGPNLPMTTVWGYGAVTAQGNPNNPLVNFHNAPSLTIEAEFGRPVRVKWINDLVDANGNYLPHLLPVDQTLHWANPPGPIDTRPTFTETPGPYTGPVPIVTHVHGAVGVGDESDGYAEAWYLPAAKNLEGFTTEGTWYNFFAGKAAEKGFGAWGPGFAIFQYPNDNRPSTVWYHDHTLGMTRVNVYAGPAGFYLIRGGPLDDRVLDSRTGRPAKLPGPAPQATDLFPPNKPYYEIPIAIQDRSFNADGSLFYPDSRLFFENPVTAEDGFIPDTDISPIWVPEFFGNTIMVNGKTWPFQTVEQRRYRFRFLNGCQSRFLILDFTALINAGAKVYQIGNEGGFLSQAVNLSKVGGVNGNNRLPMGLAERADIIVDFTEVDVGNYVLGNVGPDEPYGGGVPGDDFPKANVDTTGQVMEFRVVPAVVPPDQTTPAEFIQLPRVTPLPGETVTRKLALLEEMSDFYPDAPTAAMLGVVDNEGNATHKMWSEPISENPDVGATEIWEFYNATADAHPIHVHEVVFEVLNRQNITVTTEGMATKVVLAAGVTGPEPWETGFKDTVTAFPEQVTRIKATFNIPGQFVWHCHIVEHEDNEMMRPYSIGTKQNPNQNP